jgi:hypothetical protein
MAEIPASRVSSREPARTTDEGDDLGPCRCRPPRVRRIDIFATGCAGAGPVARDRLWESTHGPADGGSHVNRTNRGGRSRLAHRGAPPSSTGSAGSSTAGWELRAPDQRPPHDLGSRRTRRPLAFDRRRTGGAGSERQRTRRSGAARRRSHRCIEGCVSDGPLRIAGRQRCDHHQDETSADAGATALTSAQRGHPARYSRVRYASAAALLVTFMCCASYTIFWPGPARSATMPRSITSVSGAA